MGGAGAAQDGRGSLARPLETCERAGARSDSSQVRALENLKARGITALLVGHLGPLNYGAEYKAQYDRAFQELATRYDVAFYPFYFKTLMAPDGVTPDLQNYFQADGLHPNAEGVAAVVADMGPYVLRALGR